MKKIELIIRPEKLEPLKKILSKNEYSGLTVMDTRRATAKNSRSLGWRSISCQSSTS